jgi:hypothetical protein
MINQPFQFRVERDFAFGPDTFHLHCFARLKDGRIAIPEASLAMRVITPEDAANTRSCGPILTVGQESLQTLMDELWNVGIRPTEGHGSTGQLAATEKHLDHTARLLDSALQTVLNVANASLLPKITPPTSQPGQ